MRVRGSNGHGWARAGLAVGYLALLAGCPTLDVSRPIALDPDKAWEDFDSTSLRNAAECWNQAFGTQLTVEADDTVSQRVSVGYSDFVCLYAGARADPPPSAAINVCPLDYFVKEQHVIANKLFDVLLHELGHVLNIRTHGDDPLSVMTGESADTWWSDVGPLRFSREDQRMFAEANPEYVAQAACTDVTIDRYVGYPNCHCTEPATHSRCESAQQIVLDGNPTVVTGSTAGGLDEFGGVIGCGRDKVLDGPQLYYRVTFEAGGAYRVELTPPGWDAVLIAFPAGSCDPTEINRQCASYLSDRGRSGGPEEVVIMPEQTSDFIVGVESSSTNQRGSFYLTISW